VFLTGFVLKVMLDVWNEFGRVPTFSFFEYIEKNCSSFLKVWYCVMF
jgi:hypothetical protein